MKSNTGKYVVIFSMFFLLAACAPMTKLSSGQNSDYNHSVLAKYHENLAEDLQAKALEQKEILKNKPRTSYFGRNGQHIKKRVAQRIRSYEKAAETHLAKAATHRKIAHEQEKQELFTKPGLNIEPIDKAKLKSKDSSSAEDTQSYKESL